MDRAAAHATKARVYNDQGTYDLVNVDSKFKWRFQKFKVKDKKTSEIEVNPELGNQRERNTISYGLTQDLAGGGKAKKELRDANFAPQEINGSVHIEYASMSSLVSSLAAIGFKEAAEAVIEE